MNMEYRNSSTSRTHLHCLAGTGFILECAAKHCGRSAQLDKRLMACDYTPIGVYMIKIHDTRGNVIECSDTKEAIAMLEHLQRERQNAIQPPMIKALAALGSLASGEESSTWTANAFCKFTEALGDMQKRILTLLVEKRRMTDHDLRNALKIETNLELGGILSGVSKQASSHGIPARAVFNIENESKGGETTKTYGRLFYTKGKSLIFYAYDLDTEAGVKNASTFQAWGRRGVDQQQALNLGIFYEDNASKKRWVLKFDDPKTLAKIDAVFVTVEPNGGSHHPSGKQLLFAYLRVNPNHP